MARNEHTTHIIVGGGLNGLFTAYYLLAAGEKNITIIDRGQMGMESSWAGGGILSPLYPWRYADAVIALASWSQLQYPSIVQQLEACTSVDIEYHRCGMLILEDNERNQAAAWSKQYDQPITMLNQTEINRKASALVANKAGLWMPNIAQIRTPRIIHALTQDLKQKNVELIEHQTITEIITHKNQATAVRTTDKVYNCDTITVAAGAWISKVLHNLSIIPDIEPVKGQMLLLQSTPDLINTIALGDNHYLIPRKDGKILVGSTLEYVGFNKTITQDAREELLKKAYSFIPELQQYKVERHWAGLRPGTKDGIPTIAQHLEVQGLYINGGQFRNGVVMAPASGRLMADIILNQKTIVDSDAYRLRSSAEFVH